MNKFIKVTQDGNSAILSLRGLNAVLPLNAHSNDYKNGRRSRLDFEEKPNCGTWITVDQTVDEIFDIIARKSV